MLLSMLGAHVETFADSAGDVSVVGYLHRPATANGSGLVLTHGAGADCRSKLLTSVAEAFCDAGFFVLRCDLPFRQMRPTGPPMRGSAERDQKGIQRAAECLRQYAQSVCVGGHSYGGRMASMLAADEPKVASALLLLSYPLHPPNKPDQMRTAHFPRLQTPSLFVSGMRDGFGTTQELSDAISLIPASTQLMSMPSAGHELLTKANAATLPRMIVETFEDFAEFTTKDTKNHEGH